MLSFIPSPVFISTALASLFLWVWFSPQSSHDIDGIEVAAPEKIEPQDAIFELPKGSQLASESIQAMVQRPLFSQTRLPAVFNPEPEFEEPIEEVFVEEVFEPDPEPEVFVEEVAPIEPPRFAVQGFISVLDGRHALMRNLDTGAQSWVAQGDTVENWTVTMITPNEVHLTQGSVDFVVKLYE